MVCCEDCGVVVSWGGVRVWGGVLEDRFVVVYGGGVRVVLGWC